MVDAEQAAVWPRTVTFRRPALRARTEIFVLPLRSVRGAVAVAPLPRTMTRTPATRCPLRRTVAPSFVLRRRGIVLRLRLTRRQPLGWLLVAPGVAPPVPPPSAMWVGVSSTGWMTGPVVATGGRSSQTATSSIAPLQPRSQEPR